MLGCRGGLEATERSVLGEDDKIWSSQVLCHLIYVSSNAISNAVLFLAPACGAPARWTRPTLPVSALGMAPLLDDALKNLESVVTRRKEPGAVKAFQSLQKELPAVVSVSAFETPVVGQP